MTAVTALIAPPVLRWLYLGEVQPPPARNQDKFNIVFARFGRWRLRREVRLTRSNSMSISEGSQLMS
jgi:hypothetical protein